MNLKKISPNTNDNKPTWEKIKKSLNINILDKKGLEMDKEGQGVNDEIVQNHLLNKKSEIKDMVLTPLTISKIVDISKRYLPSEESKGKIEHIKAGKYMYDERRGSFKDPRLAKPSKSIKRSELTKGFDFSKTDLGVDKRSISESRKKKVNVSSLEVIFF